MPDYFFHVAVELAPELPPGNQNNQQQIANISQFFKALRPFSNSNSQSRRASRDTNFDKRKERTRQDPNLKQSCQETLTASTNTFPSNPGDHRFDHISIQGIDMGGEREQPPVKKDNIVGKGIGTAISGQYMKGRYQPLESGEEQWGIVHLYRDTEETPGLYRDSPFHLSDLWNDNPQRRYPGKPHPPPKDEECTTLCILAVPSYMTPSDFLAFVGEETCEQVTHFRMVRTARANRYMVLMKFKHGKEARLWQDEWNGKIFNSMEPETCHVVFLKSVELIQTNPTNSDGLISPSEGTSYPRMTDDPFISVTTSTKPLAPRTPSLIELPTCPVCLERMDETTGLLTIPCQHVFHCTCLQKWSGGGCPVCRYTHDDFSTRLGLYKSKSKTAGDYEVDQGPLECETCHVDTSLWQCLICGKVGCGRYEAKHAYTHFEESGHTFSMDLESKRVWDYAGDGYVHRIIQDAAKPGEKLVELPGRTRDPTALEGHEDLEMAKLDNLALEYTHLLTSQLESQRAYFEEVVERAVDKATEAAKNADRAAEENRQTIEKLRFLEGEHDFVAKGKVPELEKQKQRLEKRSTKLEEMAKDLNQKYLEEKSLAKSLMERVQFLEDSQIQDLKNKIQNLEEDNATKDLLMEGLREEHRDAMIQVSAERKLREMVERGELDEDELEGATITAGPRPLTARERLAKRLGKNVNHDPPVRKGSIPTKTSALEKEIVQTSTDPDDHCHQIIHEFASAISNSFPHDPSSSSTAAGLSRGKNWDVSKANSILEEVRNRMIEEGLLQITSPDPKSSNSATEVTITNDAGDTASPATELIVTAGKKKKGKGKAKK